jgi:hypothetical protein
MGARISTLCLAILAALSATKANALPVGSSITAGEIQLALSEHATSALPIDIQAMAEANCRPTEETPQAPGNLAQCRLKVSTQGTSQVVQLWNPAMEPMVLSPELLALQATGIDLGGDPVETSCGIWEISLNLDTTESQPISPMALKPGSDEPGQGVFSTLLEMKVRLHLTNQTTGREIDEPLVLGLGLSGPWSLAPSDKSNRKDLSTSNLRLLHGVHEKCFPVWLLQIPENLAQFLSGNCSFCFKDLLADDSPK